MKKERVQKLISQAGIASRRKAEELIKEKKVTVNGKIVQLGELASFEDEILVDGIPLYKQEKVYYLINKPEKVICSLNDPQKRTIITDLIDDTRFIFPVGRLDYNTTGTMIITNDGELTQRLLHPKYEIKRVYRARLNEPLTKKQLDFLNSDKVMLEGKQSLQEVKQVDNKSYIITLSVGTYHHIKKLFELFDLKVQSLNRIEFAGLSHIGLKKGEYRKMNIKEIRWLKKLVNLI
ncbi:pseudouridine synthase [Mesomycoplasma lagogenitalium]|uniref:Pseudouridine synthase n=1 Tax=Mesomycoplasma lagogenitalium TaxID=171286 RepID=A0ABY8LV17_9BACT|nr:pseudouridine synthase [Mesomycoplasma lagogenitalium]WGI36373.1 pseudouridine synthase [Mesomycoplasma lagogenitalium]